MREHMFLHLIRVTFYCSSARAVKCNPDQVLKYMHFLVRFFSFCYYQNSYLSDLESHAISGGK